ncbi:MAG: hypothetical protein KA144_05840 [Xanthomonadaceae bacterium]|nr:hypothetical protein [Xanthomonadaceae bacterium]
MNSAVSQERIASRGRWGAWLLAFAFAWMPFSATVAAEPDPDVAPLQARLRNLDVDPQRNALAAYERLQARQAVDALAAAKRKQRPLALQVARLRVETAEVAARGELARTELQRLELERGELLVEASRRDAERARAEAERLRIEAQIQAEETARLREAIAQESQARVDAEGMLDSVVGAEAEKLRAARELEAELARKEAELAAGGPVSTPKPKPSTGKPKPKPKPKPRP